MSTLIILLLLHANPSIPTLIADNLDRALLADSLRATQTLLVPYQADIEAAAANAHLPAALLAGVIQEESRFEPFATRAEVQYLKSKRVRRAATKWCATHRSSPTVFTELLDRSRSYGLTQIMGETAREQGFANTYLAELYLPRNALEHGALLLHRLLLRYHGDTLAAISAYNQGTARKRRGVFLNARYVYRVTLAWRAYDKLFHQSGG